MVISHNAYFESSVQSLACERHGRKFSVGIIEPGTYRFGTDAAERMTVVSGMMTVQRDGAEEWIHFPAGTNFEIAGKAGFNVKVTEAVSYQCEYL
mmetsp:Transcript_35857/g.70532  ORF Transcript_35857/g.70532 Transcript_35857/m.70532 type:complete len:95 (+) Transcript_35857:120-404(+)